MKIKFITIALLILSFAIGLAFFYRNTAHKKAEEKTVVKVSEREGGVPTAELDDMEYTEVEGEKVLWKIFAKKARYYQSAKKTTLENVRVKFFLDNGSIINLHSKKGVIFAGVKNVELSGGVTVILPEGYILRTKKVFYLNAKKEVYSTAPLHISGPQIKGVINSWRFEVNSMKGYGKNGVDMVVDIKLRK